MGSSKWEDHAVYKIIKVHLKRSKNTIVENK